MSGRGMFGHKLCAAEKDPIIVGIDTSNTLLHESCALPHAKKSYGEICGLAVADAVLSPTALVAMTEQTNVELFVRPVTVMGDAGPVALNAPQLAV